MGSTNAELLNLGDENLFGSVAKNIKLGTILSAPRVQYDAGLAVATAACTPTLTVLRLLHAITVGTGAAGQKIADPNGATPGTGHAAPNAGGTSITFNAETTGTGTANVAYLTLDPPDGADALSDDSGGSVLWVLLTKNCLILVMRIRFV